LYTRLSSEADIRAEVIPLPATKHIAQRSTDETSFDQRLGFLLFANGDTPLSRQQFGELERQRAYSLQGRRRPKTAPFHAGSAFRRRLSSNTSHLFGWGLAPKEMRRLQSSLPDSTLGTHRHVLLGDSCEFGRAATLLRQKETLGRLLCWWSRTSFTCTNRAVRFAVLAVFDAPMRSVLVHQTGLPTIAQVGGPTEAICQALG